MKPGIYRRGEVEYDRIEAINISSLLWMAKSAKHYQARPRKQTKPLSLGSTAHTATLEPERFAADYVVWDRVSEKGNECPRNGQHWDAFRAANRGKEIVTRKEHAAAIEIAEAVHSDDRCREVLVDGDPEVAIVWLHERTGIWCKGRLDWLPRSLASFADLKTCADITHDVFMSRCAGYDYHTRMAWYGDGLRNVVGMQEREQLETLLLAVESGKPHDCVVYEMPEDVIAQGRNEYETLLTKLRLALDFNEWHGVANNARRTYTLPKWKVFDPEDSIDPELDFSKEDAAS